jgi:hypothetical protein
MEASAPKFTQYWSLQLPTLSVEVSVHVVPIESGYAARSGPQFEYQVNTRLRSAAQVSSESMVVDRQFFVRHARQADGVQAPDGMTSQVPSVSQ